MQWFTCIFLNLSLTGYTLNHYQSSLTKIGGVWHTLCQNFLIKNQPHILVIDDNHGILDVFSIMLEADYKVTAKQEVKNIISTVENLHPDLILLDNSLRGKNGCDYCFDLKSDGQFCNIPVIMISANDTSKKLCLKAGADEFIEKPFSVAFMRERIAYHLRAELKPAYTQL